MAIQGALITIGGGNIISADLGAKSVTANGTYTATDDNLDGYSSVTVNVSGGDMEEYTYAETLAILNTTT